MDCSMVEEGKFGVEVPADKGRYPTFSILDERAPEERQRGKENSNASRESAITDAATDKGVNR